MRIILIAVAALLGCTSATAPLPKGQPTFDGPVLEVRSQFGPEGAFWTALVQAEPRGQTTGQIWVTFRSDTPLFWRSGATAAPTAIRAGVTVSVWTGVILESDPGHTYADALVIDSAAR